MTDRTASKSLPTWRKATLPALALAGAISATLALNGCATEVRVRGDLPPREVAYADDGNDRYVAPPAEVITSYEEDLSPHGRWVETREYGRCFVPNDVGGDWRPYTRGHWADSDDGWAWVADDREASWGTICYHYGRWTRDERVGWCWVPGTVWAPAWVAWREGGDYCGWAPLPPGGGVSVGVSFAERIPADQFVFCNERYLGEGRLYDHYEPYGRNTTIIRNTTNITNVTVINGRVSNRGVDVSRVERMSGHRVERVSVATATTHAEAERLRAEGRPVRYEPPVVKRAEEARLAERDRVQRRNADSTAAREAERTRVNGRATAADQARTAEHDRAVQRDTAAREAERARVNGRATASEQEKAAERARVNNRASTAEQEKTAEHERAVQRDTAAREAERTRANTRTNTAEQDKAAEHQRALERERTAPRSATPTPTDRAAEHERAVARERGATATPTARERGSAAPAAQSDADREAEHQRALAREKAKQGDK